MKTNPRGHQIHNLENALGLKLADAIEIDSTRFDMPVPSDAYNWPSFVRVAVASGCISSARHRSPIEFQKSLTKMSIPAKSPKQLETPEKGITTF